MVSVAKRRRESDKSIQAMHAYGVDEAVALVKKHATAKFDETIDVAVMLGVNPTHSDQVVRSATVMPHGTGKTVRVAVFAEGDKAKEAEDAGADIVGLDDLAESVKKGEMNFDVVIATPAAMKVVGRLGQVLGPRGLMPNPKVGTVSADVATAVKNAKGGQVRYRTDKKGIIHAGVGKASFVENHLKENIEALMADLKKLKPSSAKGVYFKKLVLSSTMGPSILVDISTVVR